jgi:hypothetical protein
LVKRWLRGLCGAAAALLIASACAQVLGIDDAELDPLLQTDAGDDALCQQYCDKVLENCLDEHAVYPERDTCLGVCAILPAGQQGAETGNSIHCRLTNADLARLEPELHCARAGPGGNSVCGENCEAYCLLFEAACQSDFSSRFNGQSECLADCRNTVPDLGGYDASIREGDSVQCRLYHVSVATLAPSEHCGHASGLPPCVDGGSGGAGGSGGSGSGGG